MRTTLTYNIWTKEEEQKLISLIGTTSFEKMVIYFPNRTAASLLKKSVKLGYSSKYKHHLYTVNKNYWNDLDLVKCYFGGFIATDGNLASKRKALQIQLNPKDISILERFKEEVKYTGKIFVSQRTKYKSEEMKDVCELRINCGINKWYVDLFKHFNITPKKSRTLQPPNITDIYLKYAYTVGLLDGDGWICYTKRKRPTIGYVSASRDMMEWIKMIFESIVGKINVEISKGNGEYYYLAFGNKQSLIIIDYLRQFPVPKLARKWDKPEVLERIAKYKSEHPELFKTLNPAEIQHLLPENNKAIPK